MSAEHSGSRLPRIVRAAGVALAVGGAAAYAGGLVDAAFMGNQSRDLKSQAQTLPYGSEEEHRLELKSEEAINVPILTSLIAGGFGAFGAGVLITMGAQSQLEEGRKKSLKPLSA